MDGARSIGERENGRSSSSSSSSSSEVILYAVSNELSDDREDERA